jgi:hypothetical protein
MSRGGAIPARRGGRRESRDRKATDPRSRHRGVRPGRETSEAQGRTTSSGAPCVPLEDVLATAELPPWARGPANGRATVSPGDHLQRREPNKRWLHPFFGVLVRPTRGRDPGTVPILVSRLSQTSDSAMPSPSHNTIVVIPGAGDGAAVRSAGSCLNPRTSGGPTPADRQDQLVLMAAPSVSQVHGLGPAA